MKTAWKLVGYSAGGALLNLLFAQPLWHWTADQTANRTAGAVSVLGAQVLLLGLAWCYPRMRSYRLRLVRKGAA